MSDIKRKKPRITEFGPCHDTVQEIESLRQRVKELEEDIETVAEKLSKECAASLRLMEELAALKAGQGEPICYLREEWLSYEQSAEGQPGAFPVYTSAPTIPEGWQLEQAMYRMFNFGKDNNTVSAQCEMQALGIRARFSGYVAAPEPEESLNSNVDSAFVSLVDDPEGRN